MPNIAAVLKTEISRIARKEIRSETERLHQALSQYRRDVTALKRQVAALEKIAGRIAKTSARPEAVADAAPAAPALRFSASRLAAQRKRLELSAEAFGQLIGVSGQSIYKWESGKARPRQKQLQAIAATRKLSKQEAAAKLGAS